MGIWRQTIFKKEERKKTSTINWEHTHTRTWTMYFDENLQFIRCGWLLIFQLLSFFLSVWSPYLSIYRSVYPRIYQSIWYTLIRSLSFCFFSSALVWSSFFWIHPVCSANTIEWYNFSFQGVILFAIFDITFIFRPSSFRFLCHSWNLPQCIKAKEKRIKLKTATYHKIEKMTRKECVWWSVELSSVRHFPLHRGHTGSSEHLIRRNVRFI